MLRPRYEPVERPHENVDIVINNGPGKDRSISHPFFESNCFKGTQFVFYLFGISVFITALVYMSMIGPDVKTMSSTGAKLSLVMDKHLPTIDQEMGRTMLTWANFNNGTRVIKVFGNMNFTKAVRTAEELSAYITQDLGIALRKFTKQGTISVNIPVGTDTHDNTDKL